MQRRHFLASIPALAALPALAGQEQGPRISARKDLVFSVPDPFEIAPCGPTHPARWRMNSDRLPILQLLGPPMVAAPGTLSFGCFFDGPHPVPVVLQFVTPRSPFNNYCLCHLCELACDTIPNLVQRFEQQLFSCEEDHPLTDEPTVISHIQPIWLVHRRDSAIGFSLLPRVGAADQLVVVHRYPLDGGGDKVVSTPVEPVVFPGSDAAHVERYRKELVSHAKGYSGYEVILRIGQKSLDCCWPREVATTRLWVS